MSSNPTKKNSQFIAGLDSIRLISAVWVTVGHIGLGNVRFPNHPSLTWLVRGFLGNVCNGPAAVIVFFLISGFCIHLPYAQGLKFSYETYYLRRYTRVLLPIFFASFLGKLCGVTLMVFSYSILWSVTCELIYYTFYPVFLFLKKKYGWKPLLGMSFLMALIAITRRTEFLNYPESDHTNWALGLPCWLLGCYLAETYFKPSYQIRRATLWRWRLGIWGYSSLASVMRFHSSVGYPFTLTLFGILCYFWLREEINYFIYESPWPWLERMGKATFSLYLCHLPAAELPKLLGFPPQWDHEGMYYCLAAVLSYLFYKWIEAPSHRFSKWLAHQTVTWIPVLKRA